MNGRLRRFLLLLAMCLALWWEETKALMCGCGGCRRGGAVGLEATEGKGSSVSWQTSALLVNVQLEVGVTFHIFS